jgi:hypothetical protein
VGSSEAELITDPTGTKSQSTEDNREAETATEDPKGLDSESSETEASSSSNGEADQTPGAETPGGAGPRSDTGKTKPKVTLELTPHTSRTDQRPWADKTRNANQEGPVHRSGGRSDEDHQ